MQMLDGERAVKVRGASSRQKTVLIREMGPEEVHKLLAGPVR